MGDSKDIEVIEDACSKLLSLGEDPMPSPSTVPQVVEKPPIPFKFESQKLKEENEQL